MKSLLRICVVLALASGVVMGQVPSAGLVAYYPFTGNANDEGGNGLNATVYGATLTSDRHGNPNSAYDFDYASAVFGQRNDDVYVPFSPLLNVSHITLAVWIYPRSYSWSGNPGSSTIINRYEGGYSNPNGQAWGMGFDQTSLSAGFLEASTTNSQNSAGVSCGTPPLNTWSHVVFTFDGSMCRLYLNGSLVGTSSTTLAMNTLGTSGISIGETDAANGYWHYFDGVLDDILIYDRALTETEISGLYHAGGWDNGLVAYYPFNGNAHDSSGNGNHGTVNGATPATDRFGQPGKAYSFDGAGSYISVPHSPLLSTPKGFSVNLWLYIEDGGSESPRLFSKGWSPNAVEIATDGFGPNPKKLGFGGGLGGVGYGVLSKSLVANGSWRMLTCTDDRNTRRIYLDGVLDTSYFHGRDSIPQSSVDLVFGKNSQRASDFFLGRLDDIRIYNRRLSDAEVANLYQPATSELIAYYPFNGTAYDSSGNGNHGTVDGAAPCVDRYGDPGQAYEFNGVNSSIQVPHTPSFDFTLSRQFTFKAWIKTQSFAHQAIAFKGSANTPGSYFNEWALIIEPDRTLRLKVNTNADNSSYSYLTSSPSLTLNTWCQVVAVWDGIVGVQKLYLNGVEIGSTGAVAQIVTMPTQPFWLGYVGDGPFDGFIDDVSLYRRALSDEEIDSIYQSEKSEFPEAGLVAYYPFNGSATDESGNGHDGTVYGPVLATDRFGDPNRCYYFADQKYISVAHDPVFNVTGDFTVSAWYKTDGPGTNYMTIAAKRPGNATFWEVTVENWSKKMVFPLFNDFSNLDYHVSTRDVSFSTWQHVVAVIRNDSTFIWLDGVLDSGSKITIPRPVNTSPLTIGDARVGNNEWFVGWIDDLRIYDRPLTDSEIGELYHEGGYGATTTTWQMQISAAGTSTLDTENFAGVSDDAADAQDESFDVPEPPPAPGNHVSLYFPHPEWGSVFGNRFAHDIKKNTALADTVKRWYFEVNTNVVNDSITLTFADDRIPSAFGRYLTDLKTGQRIDLGLTPTYKYYSASDTVRGFSLMVGDSVAPALVLTSPSGGNIWRSGSTKTISWATSDGTGIDSVFVYASSNAGSHYSLIGSLGYAQTTPWTVPAEYLNHGYAVKVTARDSLGHLSSAKSGTTFTVVGDSLATSSAAGWSLISSPMVLADSSVGAIFGASSYVWSFSQDGGYVRPSFISPGHGYWLGLVASKDWYTKGAAIEVDSSVHPLQLGHNAIGNKHVRDIAKADLLFLRSGTEYSFDAAVSGGLLANVLYGYSGTGYTTADTLKPFAGYWFSVLQAGVQMVQKPGAIATVPLGKQEAVHAANWELPIKAATGSLSDDIAALGVKPDASQQFDPRYDAPRPPRSPGSTYLEVYFVNTGENFPSVFGNKYARDFRDTSHATWAFTVESSENADVTLTWDKSNLSGLSAGDQIHLVDDLTGTRVDMKTAGAYSFHHSSSRTFAVSTILTSVGGTEPAVPSSYSLSQNYPNPFNPSTSIRYGLPERSMVQLTVYNALGQPVATLVQEEQGAGYHEVQFDASGLASGVYLYRLQAGAFVQTLKLVLLR